MASDGSTRDGMGLELYDVAPVPAGGLVMEVFCDDATGEWTVRSFADGLLPLELVEQFLAVARRRLSLRPD